MNRVLVVIINYYTEHDIYAQVMPFRDTGIRFMIVDNGSRYKAPLKALNDFANVEIVVPKDNLGYLKAGFFGLDAALAEGIMPDWVLISNPDITFSTEFFEKLGRINGHRFAMLAPRMISGRTGKDQNPYMLERPGRKYIEKLVQIHRRPLLANAYRLAREISRSLGISLPQSTAAPGEVIYASHGSCMIISHAFLSRYPRINYPAFLFCEELFIAEHDRKLGSAIVYRPDLRLFHEEHRTTRVFRTREMIAHHEEALVYFLKTYDSP